MLASLQGQAVGPCERDKRPPEWRLTPRAQPMLALGEWRAAGSLGDQAQAGHTPWKQADLRPPLSRPTWAGLVTAAVDPSC